MRVSLVFPAFNRLEFTKQSWAALMANTDWSLVSEFHIYDDGSTDGTREWLLEARELCRDERMRSGQTDALCHLHASSFRSPMGVTLDWIRRSTAPLLAKLDNDTVYPPGWLNVALDVLDRNPELSMLGLECMREPAVHIHGGMYRTRRPDETRNFGYLPAPYVSGLFLGRREVFESNLPEDGGYFGLEEFQQARGVKAGWILPSLPAFLLDRLPMEPWRGLSESYVRQGWQRAWSLDLRYKPEQSPMWDWWKPA